MIIGLDLLGRYHYNNNWDFSQLIKISYYSGVYIYIYFKDELFYKMDFVRHFK